MDNRKGLKYKKNREIIFKTLTDPKFRKEFMSNPQKALGLKEFTDINKKEVETLLKTVEEIEARVGRLADALLCADNGPCGIAART